MHEKEEKDEAEIHYTKYEKARIIESRSLQISMGAPYLIELSEEELEKIKYNPITIAKIEFEKGLIPIRVKRPSRKN